MKDSLKNVYVNILGFFFSFCYIEKLIVKDVSNIIGISYSIAIIKRERERERESTVCILDARVFREMRDLIPFHVFLISKYRFHHLRHAIACACLHTCLNLLRHGFYRMPKTDMNPSRRAVFCTPRFYS